MKDAEGQGTAAPRVRRATPADIEALVEACLALWREIGKITDDSDAAELVDATRAYFRQALPTKEFIAWVAEAEGRVVVTSGLMLYRRPPTADNLSGREGFLTNMYTVPAWRGRGLAAALLAEALAFAKSAGGRRIRLHATEAGRPIYLKAGFVPKASAMELTW